MEHSNSSLKEAVVRLLDELPTQQIVEVLDFATFIKDRSVMGETHRRLVVKTTPISHLNDLVGLASLGGDALEDSEGLYDD